MDAVPAIQTIQLFVPKYDFGIIGILSNATACNYVIKNKYQS